MTDIVVLGGKETVTGFRLAGVTSTSISTTSSIKDDLKSALAQEAKIIIITEDLAAFIKDEISEIGRKPMPIIVQVPGIKGFTGNAKKELKETIRRAVGFDITATG